MSTPPPPADARRQGSFASLLAIVRRHRLLALLPFLFVLTAAASFAFFLPGLWSGRAVILVDRQQIPETYVKPTVQGDWEAQLLMLSQEILSRPRLAQIIQELNLYPNLRATQSPDEIIARMRRDIRIEQAETDPKKPKESRLVAFSVAYAATDPNTAMVVTNRLADLYVEENGRFREQQAASTSEFLENQLKEVRARLQEQERRSADYKERFLGELPEQRETNLRTMERLQQQLQLAHETARRAQERQQLITRSLAEIDQSTSTAAAGNAGPNVTPAEARAARLALLRQELAELKTRFTDTYPDVINLKEQVRVLEERVEADAAERKPAAPVTRPKDGKELRTAPQNPYVVSLMQQLDQANVEAKTTAQEIAQLNEQLVIYQRRIENTPRREQELALITRDYETTRDLFRSLLAKRGEAEIAADLEQRQKGERFRIIESALLPDRPLGPNRLRLLMVGLAVAAGVAILAVVLAEQVDTSYRNVEEVRASLPVPVLSVIPKIASARDRIRLMRQRRLATAAVAIGLLAVIGTSFALAHGNDALVSLLTPMDTMAGKR